MSPLAALHLAQAAPAAVDAASTVAQATPLLVGIMALSVFVNQALGAFNNFRKLKGADPTADGRYATKAETQALKAEQQALKEDVIALKADVSGISRTLTNEFSSLNRSIGVLEGMLKTMSAAKEG